MILVYFITNQSQKWTTVLVFIAFFLDMNPPNLLEAEAKK